MLKVNHNCTCAEWVQSKQWRHTNCISWLHSVLFLFLLLIFLVVFVVSLFNISLIFSLLVFKKFISLIWSFYCQFPKGHVVGVVKETAIFIKGFIHILQGKIMKMFFKNYFSCFHKEFIPICFVQVNEYTLFFIHVFFLIRNLARVLVP